MQTHLGSFYVGSSHEEFDFTEFLPRDFKTGVSLWTLHNCVWSVSRNNEFVETSFSIEIQFFFFFFEFLKQSTLEIMLKNN